MWSVLLRANMGIRAHPGLTRRKASEGHIGTQSLGCAGQTVRPSLYSISQTRQEDLTTTDFVRYRYWLLLHLLGDGPRLIFVTAGENGPNNAGELVGERDRQHVAVKPLRCLFDPGP
jgi:hypothetical protein